MKFSQFFQDGSGSYSSTRLAFLLWAMGVLTVWVYESITTYTLAQIDTTVVTILGVLMMGKVVQSYSPNDAAPTTTITTTPAGTVTVTPATSTTVTTPVSTT
jgi:hypothetical protein